MAQTNTLRLESVDEIPGMEFYQIPAFSKKTGASVCGVEITGDPSTSCNVVASFKGSDEDPGDGGGWFAGPGQDPSCARVVLNFSVPLHAFGVSFMHFSGAGINATNAGTLTLFDGPDGTGEKIVEAYSKGRTGAVDFVGLACRRRCIRSAVICSQEGTADFAADGYAVLAERGEADHD
jgi:hypothetical protein